MLLMLLISAGLPSATIKGGTSWTIFEQPPVIAFLPEGNMEPATNISLRFKEFDGVFGYFWDEEISKIGMEVTVK